jgi:hypothetical protein
LAKIIILRTDETKQKFRNLSKKIRTYPWFIKKIRKELLKKITLVKMHYTINPKR